MNFSDIFKKTFLEGFSGTEITPQMAIAALLTTTALAIYIFFIYRLVTKKTFYSLSFNISLVGTAIITASVVFTIQSSLVVSLGMVGALSIIRYRTAVKEPIDLMFLFWSVSTGIICGAGLAEIAVITSIFITVVIIVLAKIPLLFKPRILVVNGDYTDETEDIIENTLKQNSTYFKVKSRCITRDKLELIVELRCKEEKKIISVLQANPHISMVSLISQEGEATY